MLLIFDWDGTLADSREHIVHAMQLAIKEQQLSERTDEQCAQMIGLGLNQVAMSLFPELDHTGVNQFSANYSAHYTQLLDHYGATRFFPGAIATLEQLHKQGHVLAVATGKSRRGLNRVLEAGNISHLFHATRAADETASKPNPLMLDEILFETGMSVAQAVMIGDTTFDMEMAANLEMPRIGVTYGMHTAEQLQVFSPALMIDGIDELLQWSRLN